MSENNQNNNPPLMPSEDDLQVFFNAAKFGNRDAVEKMLDRYGPAIMKEHDDINANALTWAAWAGHVSIIELLLDRGANIEMEGTVGRAALGWAVSEGRENAIELLLERGASLQQRDNSGMTPVDIAKKEGRRDIHDLLVNFEKNRREAEERRIREQEDAAARAISQARQAALKNNAVRLKPKPSSGR